MKKRITNIISTVFLLVNVFSESNKIQLTISDPMNMEAPAIHWESQNSENEIKEYIDFKIEFLKKVNFVQGANEFRTIGGDWIPSVEKQYDSADSFSPCSHKFSIIIGNHAKLFIKDQHNQAWELYKYGEYYLTDLYFPDKNGPLLLLHIKNNTCYFYTIEGHIWTLIPFHKKGDICFNKSQYF